MKVLFIPQLGDEEPWLSDVRASLASDAALSVLDREEPLEPQFRNVDVVIDQGGHATSEIIECGAAVGVRLWQVLGTGLDGLDLHALASAGIAVASTPGNASAIALAEHALLLLLACARRLRIAQAHLDAGRMHAPLGEELCERTLGIVGLGASGRELTKRAGALGMRVLGIDEIALEPAQQRLLGVRQLRGDGALADLLAESDCVSLHLPLTEATRGLIGVRELALMKPTAMLVNVARGALVDEAALHDALATGRLGAAGLDVFVDEPPSAGSPLLALPTVVATPHVAGMTRETSRRRARFCADNVARLAQGSELLCRHSIR